MNRFHPFWIALFGVAILTLSATAADYHVDAQSGNNTTGDGSQGSPWKTITYALQQIPAPAPTVTHVLHVNPGYYDSLIGESFPVTIPAGVWIRGVDRDHAVLFGDGIASVALLQFGPGVDLRNVVENLTFHDGDPAILLPPSAGPGLGPTIRNCCLYNNRSAFLAVAPASGTRSPVLDRCEIESSRERGVRLEGNAGGTLTGRLTACRFVYNNGVALDLQAGTGIVSPLVVNCAFINNFGTSIRIVDNVGSSPVLTHVTVRDSRGSGLQVATTAPNPPLQVRNSIFHSSQTDLVDVPASTVVHCCFGSATGSQPPQGGTNGNKQVDPLFKNQDDADLSPFSPVIDQATFQTGLDPTVDLHGDARPADGDGDSLHQPDMGADEYNPLYLTGFAPAPGSVTVFNLDLPTNTSIPYYIGLSFTNMGIPLGGQRVLPLGPDMLLALVLNGQLPGVVFDFVGNMNPYGFASGHVNWPNDPRLRGTLVFAGAITLQSGYPADVRCVTNGIRITL